MQLYPTNLLHKYLLINKPNASTYTLRKGFYLVIDYKSVIGANNKEYISALALYSDEPTFNEVLLVNVNLHPLKNYHSKSPAKSFAYDALVNNIIEIKEVNLSYGKYTTYQIIWDFMGGGKEVIEHFRLLERQQYRVLVEIAFEDWLEEENEQLYFDQLIRDEYELSQEENFNHDKIQAEQLDEDFLSDEDNRNSNEDEALPNEENI